MLDAEMEEIRGQDEATEIWKKYQQGVNHHNQINLYEKVRKAYRFFEGDQWHGLESDGEVMPQYNFIQPVVEHKAASVAMNGMAINYSPMEYGGDYRTAARACDVLNRYAARQWELLKMDKLGWAIIKDACIAGDSYLYFYDRNLHAQIIDGPNVYFADETSRDIQEQDWIIIAERRFVRDVRREAKENGLSQEEIDLIGPDSDTGQLLGDDARQNSQQEDKRCTSLLYMRKNKEGIVTISRSTQNVVYQPEEVMQGKEKESGEPAGKGMQLYPLAGLWWVPKKESARGVGEVTPLIPNQIEVNKMLVRRLMNAKITAFGRMVYNKRTVANPESVAEVGSAIEVMDTPAAKVTDHVAYLHPSPMSADAKNLTDEMISQTRDLAGAGDAALGQINPEQASGSAIIAVRDQAALPLNEQIADYKQFCEDVAAIWFDLWVAYHPNGMEVELPPTEQPGLLAGMMPQGLDIGQGMGQTGGMAAGTPSAAPMGQMGQSAAPMGQMPGMMMEAEMEPTKEIIPAEVLQQMRPSIRIDVSPVNPYSKYAQEQSLAGLFQAGAITFEEYVEALDEQASTPKQKLQEIIDRRMERQREQMQVQQTIEQKQSRIQQLEGWQQEALGVMDQQQALMGTAEAAPMEAAAPMEGATIMPEGVILQ